ncbi:MAG: carbohydrate kinase family protein [Cyclobacteriaceae bacterium]|nr:carbohydrate kinase family protein [Cyclobacteriaceae bacterium]
MEEKKYDVIVVGELNVDIILNNIDSFPEIGKEKLAGKMDTTLGSSSAIFASNLSSLGARVAFIGKIGQDQNGEIVLNSLQKKGVDASMIIRSEAYNTGATIVLNFAEDRANITYPGAMEHLIFEDIQTEQLLSSKHLHFSSYFFQPGIKPDLASLFKKAKSLGLTTSLDPQWDPAETWDFDYAKILPYVDIFLPNEGELKHITGMSNLEDAVNTVQEFCNILVVKNGSKGSSIYHDGQVTHAKPFLNTSVVDAIGAGDSFNAGFIFKFIRKSPLQECHQFGNLMGAVSTTQPGGTTAFENYESVMEIARAKFGY